MYCYVLETFCLFWELILVINEECRLESEFLVT